MSALQLVKDNEMEIATIATSAVLIDLSISTWTGRKRDRETTAEVIRDKQAGSSKSASVIKNLMSDDKDLDSIRAYQQDTRLYLVKHTLRWSDGGTRLLPTNLIFEVTSEMDGRIAEFNTRVDRFVSNYALKVSAAAFKLGQLFNRAEYPDVGDVRRKFAMQYVINPVPTSGDFRVDVQKDIGEYLKKQFAQDAEKRLTEMMREPWERIYEQLTHVKERMDASLTYEPGPVADGRRTPKLFQSLIDNALDVVNLLDKMNITNDPQLADCAAKMRRLFSNLDIKSMRESKEVQASVKTRVEEILSNFDFSGLAD